MISLGVFLDESELPRLHSALNAFTSQHHVIFSFYVRKRITPSSIPVFFTADKKNIYFPSGIFPMNILRDMSIESIDTSHYVAVDVDVFFSFTLEDDIERNRKLLDDQNNTVTLFSLYLYYYQMNHSVFWTITSIWPDLSIRGNKCPIGDDQLSQLSALSISIL